MVVCVFLISSILHLSMGETPGSAYDFEGYSGVQNDFIGDVTYSLGSPIGIFTRFTFFIQKIEGLFMLNSSFKNIFQTIPFLITILFLVRYAFVDLKVYQSLLIYFCLPFLLLFTILYLQNKAVSYEMRHFASVSFVFFPGIIAWLNSLKIKKYMLVLVLSINLLDAAYYFVSLKKIQETHSTWNSLKLPNEDVQLLNEIEKWDKKTFNGLLIIEDYWQLSIGARKNDKIVVHKKNGIFNLVSGMELDYPDQINLDQFYLNKYSSIFIISSNSKTDGVIQLTKSGGYNKIKITDHFSVYKRH